MPVQANITADATVNGLSFRRATVVTTDGQLVKSPTLAAAKAGALTTRTNNTSGTLTMAAGHDIDTGDRLDVYWTNPDGTVGRRYGVTVGTVSTNEVPVSGGAGDNLPADETAVRAMVPQLESFSVVAAAMNALLVGCNGPATAVFRDGSGTTVATVEVDSGTNAYQWDSSTGVATPFGANVADVYLSHGDSAASLDVSAVALIN